MTQQRHDYRTFEDVRRRDRRVWRAAVLSGLLGLVALAVHVACELAGQPLTYSETASHD